jgi:hypothetical protein
MSSCFSTAFEIVTNFQDETQIWQNVYIFKKIIYSKLIVKKKDILGQL